MRIKNLYNPPTIADRDPVVPWAPSGTKASSRIVGDGCEITVVGNDTCWLYPPEPRPAGLANVAWQRKDDSYVAGLDNNMTIPIHSGVTVLTRLCGYEDKNLLPMLMQAGLPLVFAASDHPY